MKVRSPFLRRLELDPTYGLLNARSAYSVYHLFLLLDFRGTGGIDDIQFSAFLRCVTDLDQKQVDKVFDIFDLDRSGSCEFDEVSPPSTLVNTYRTHLAAFSGGTHIGSQCTKRVE